MDGDADLEASIRRGLGGELLAARYGLPFLGDNAFLPDRIDTLDTLPAAHWYERVGTDDATIRPRTTRLTVWIDRADLSRTTSALFAPTPKATTEPPPNAWTSIDPPAPPPSARRKTPKESLPMIASPLIAVHEPSVRTGSPRLLLFLRPRTVRHRHDAQSVADPLQLPPSASPATESLRPAST